MLQSSAGLTTELKNLDREFSERVVPLVDKFRQRQELDGTVTDPTDHDVDLLNAIKSQAVSFFSTAGLEHQAQAFVRDVEMWLAAGLSTLPDFGLSRDALIPPADGGFVLFLAPVHTTNSSPQVGHRFECFLALRREPAGMAELNQKYPHPKNNCQTLVLLSASEGLRIGSCLVFFPENVAAKSKVVDQAYAMFFFSKFRKIHDTFAVPAARRVLGENSRAEGSAGLSAEISYEARSTWGYLHDYFHYQGRWPFDKNISLKMNWFVGLLEETKVDAKTILECVAGAVPFAEEQIDMILLERMFRYPLAVDATRNFDSGTGVFLYSWLRKRNAIVDCGELLELRKPEVLQALQEYVDAIEALEEAVLSTEEYKVAAKTFVRLYLLEDPAGNDRFVFTEDQTVLLRPRIVLDEIPPLRYISAEM